MFWGLTCSVACDLYHMEWDDCDTFHTVCSVSLLGKKATAESM
jgi:hypothetical protein